MQYAKKAGHPYGNKEYTIRNRWRMEVTVMKRICECRFTRLCTLFIDEYAKTEDIIFNRRLTRRIWMSQDGINNRFWKSLCLLLRMDAA